MESSLSHKYSILNGKSQIKPVAMRLAIASTFTCNPIENTLRYWGEKFGYKVAINFSPYDQVFQELLDLDSTLNHPENDARILIVRFEDWIRNLSKTNEAFIHSHIADNVHHLSEYAATSAGHRKSPIFLTIVNNSKDSFIKPDKQREYEQLLHKKLSNQSNVFVLTSSEINKNYSVQNYDDPQRDRLGHIPFTNEYFTALGTSVFRRVIATKRKTFKVIVLDCDNTLWEGACGELGANGINLSASFLNLQNFMLRQKEAGKILCLCSKNVEKDVDSVFSDRTDMLLSKDDVVSFKINWAPKSQNIRELAEELNLGLDSFIFVDDNPVECAEVRANCPEVLTLNLPEKPQEIPTFLNHVWPFDILQATYEDQKRTKLYQDNIKRSTFQKSSSSLKEFIDGLNLDISIKDIAPKEISRVSQLTFRTNQFNFTTRRRSEEEIKNLLRTVGFKCKVCRVKDRFGDYGLVGVILYKKLSESIMIDSFMLSCRVLGRGVEHKMLKFVGETALSDKIDTVQINFSKTDKNLPALNFVESLIKNFSGDISFDKNGYFFPSGYLNSLAYNPENNVNGQNPADDQQITLAPNESELSDNLIFEKIANELNSVDKIHQHLHSNGHSTVEKPIVSTTKERDTLQIITEIWEEILDNTGIRPDQHFFDLGGTSLKAVEVLSELNERFNKNLTIVSLFEHSTILSLVNLVECKSTEENEFNKILERAGARRKRFRHRNE